MWIGHVRQRFGSALNLTPHFHSLVLDGVYLGPSHSLGDFVALPPPRPPTSRASWRGLRAASCVFSNGMASTDKTIPLPATIP
ncbi:MAG: transposase [Deltaproteobacteria bacterium]|nr:transposase [Deltaproteobacteria bacterium]